MTDKIKDSILVINTGSSSVKFQVFSRYPSLELLVHGKVSDLGSSPLFTATDETQELKENQAEKIEIPDDYTHEKALHFILNWIEAQKHESDLARRRIIAAYLGNGASLCAMHNGISIDTTMGMTTLDGLPMGTRCGAFDPGVVIYMIRELNLSPDDAESLLYHQSGLLGLSDWTHDVRLLQDSNESKAQFALDYFCMRTAQLAGMMTVVLGGIDGIVFTGGIGENSSLIRDKILRHLDFLRPFEVHVIKTNEEGMMAIHTVSVFESHKEKNR